MTKGIASLSLQGKPVVAVKPIEAKYFDNLKELLALAEIQGLPYIIVTQEAWSKYEALISSPVEDK